MREGPVEQGWARVGIYDEEFSAVNLDQAWIISGGLRVPPPLSRLRLKQWQHFALVLPELYVGLAVVDPGFGLGTSWCHVVQRDAGHGGFEHRHQGPRVKVHVSRQLWDGVTRAGVKGYHVEIKNALSRGEHRIQLAIDARRDRPAVRAALRCVHDLAAIRPLVAVLPVGEGRAMYTHKVPLPLEGAITVGQRSYTATPDRCFALLDIHKAHYPRHTFWNWATLVGRDARGRVLGLNLTRNVNPDDRELNENALWVDGQLRRLGAARFELDRDDVLRPWRVRTLCGAVDLVFTPRGERSERLNLWLMRSMFHQLHGTFSGTVRSVEGVLDIDRLFGLCEDHDVRW